MLKKYKVLLFLLIVACICVGGLFAYKQLYTVSVKKDIASTAVDTSVFRPYILGKEIDFSETGNSADYVSVKDGWGGQEPAHRCAVGSETIMRLYIPDSTGATLRLIVDAFGVFPPKTDKYQEITIFANDIEIGVWHVGFDGPFNIEIPSDIITDNTLTLRFVPAKPYSPPPDVRKLSMAVKTVKIEKIFGAQTKKKIGKWVKENLMDGGIKQTYDTNISKEEEWQ